jgi:hypothetical protein
MSELNPAKKIVINLQFKAKCEENAFILLNGNVVTRLSFIANQGDMLRFPCFILL